MSDHLLVSLVLALLAAVLIFLGVARFLLRGPDLSAFDHPGAQSMSRSDAPSDGHRAVVASLGNAMGMLEGVPRSRHVAVLREYMDTLFPDDRPEAPPNTL